MKISNRQLEVLQNISLEKQQSRIQDVAILLAGNFDEFTIYERGYSTEEIEQAKKILNKDEVRSMNTTIQTNRLGKIITVKDGFKMGTTIIEPVPSVIDKCLNVTADSNTGISVIPIISETGISYEEVRAVGLEQEIEVSTQLFNSLSEQDIKTQLDIITNLEKENRLAIELETIESTGTKLTDLFKINAKYIGENYIMLSQTNLDKISSLTLGSEIALEYERIDGVLVPTINKVPVIVNNNLTKVVLFTPKHIGISNFALDETEEIITERLVRVGKKMWRRICGMQPKVLVTDSAKAITLA